MYILRRPNMFGTPLKRKREESPVLVRHKTLYLEDGDIVLTAPYGQRRLVFRVDKIFLARHSPIFKDMLAFSPGGDSADMYEGVPRVDLTDRAQDLAVLLGGMYNMTYVVAFYTSRYILADGVFVQVRCCCKSSILTNLPRCWA